MAVRSVIGTHQGSVRAAPSALQSKATNEGTLFEKNLPKGLLKVKDISCGQVSLKSQPMNCRSNNRTTHVARDVASRVKPYTRETQKGRSLTPKPSPRGSRDIQYQ